MATRSISISLTLTEPMSRLDVVYEVKEVTIPYATLAAYTRYEEWLTMCKETIQAANPTLLPSFLQDADDEMIQIVWRGWELKHDVIPFYNRLQQLLQTPNIEFKITNTELTINALM